MSLENKIEELTKAIHALTSKLEVVVLNQPSIKPVEDTVELVLTVVPDEEQPVNVVPSMPELPTFSSAAKTTNPTPFADSKGLVNYIMNVYKEMGPQKGAQIQDILVDLGYQNINDVRAEHYDKLFQAVEKLRE